MANITSPTAIRFANVRVRGSADGMCQAYTRCVAVGDRWTALGAGQPALDQMQAQIRDAADYVAAAFDLAFWTEKVWFAIAAGLFPNDASPVFDNGGYTAVDPTRPGMTGAVVTAVVTRAQQFQNWLLSATGSFTDGARGGVAWLNTVVQVSGDGPSPIVQADAGNFVNRCSELKANYQAGGSANLNSLLAAAVNPYK
ncbi:MAG: hypothetical protein JWO38_6849 [Gemmataceae bacterium]|nr:hypothetical protein [Gemmataceae bacterium]